MNENINVKQYPTSFLEELFEHNIRVVHTKIQLLNWDEQVLKEIQGIVKSGSYNADGTSRVRRNLSLTFSVKDRDDELVYKYLTPDKKIKLYIGLENQTSRYQEDEIIWFNMGIFILTEPSYSHSVDTATISINAQDKMTMLNGTLGGRLPAPVSFVEKRNGKNYSFSWRDIFLSAAVNFGNENPAKVIIDSVPDYINEYTQVKNVAGLKDKFIHINAPGDVDGERIITRAWSPAVPETEINFSKGDRIYKLRRFGPPDPSAGTVSTQESYQKNVNEPLTSIFEDIVEAMSNTHEFFYTRDGDLMFQPIKNYVNEVFDPEKDTDLGYFAYELDMDDFIPNYLGLPFTYNFADKKTIIRYNNNPSYTNIKNDFIATRETGEILEIAIDHKPTIREIKEWFIGIAEDFNMDSPEMDFLAKDGRRREPYNPQTNTVPFEFKEATAGKPTQYIEVPLDKIPWQIGLGLKNYFIRNIYGASTARVLPRWGKECESMIFKWIASEDKKTLLPNTGIFNPSFISVGTPWLAGYPMAASANTENDVESLDKQNPIFTDKGDSAYWTYFLDIIPTESKLGKYSIELIGKRSIGVSNKQATTIFRTNPKELIVITETELQDLGGDMILDNLKAQGEAYAVIRDIQDQFFMPTAITKNKNVMPYSAMVGDPGRFEQLRYMFAEGNGTVHEYLAGGKHTGTIGVNKNMQDQDKPGYVTISAGVYTNPVTKRQFTQTDFATINTPFGSETDLTEYGFIAYLLNKNSRCPDSGNHNYFAVVKNIGTQWYYAKQNNGKPAWTKFNWDKTNDFLVAVLSKTVYKGSADFPDWSSGRIDDFQELFNIRDSKMDNLFTIDGAVDLFSSVRNLIYQHTNTSDVVTIDVLPVYHLEPNTLIYAEDEISNISGMFMITGYSIQLNTEGSPTMNISAIQTNPAI